MKRKPIRKNGRPIIWTHHARDRADQYGYGSLKVLNPMLEKADQIYLSRRIRKYKKRKYGKEHYGTDYFKYQNIVFTLKRIKKKGEDFYLVITFTERY